MTYDTARFVSAWFGSAWFGAARFGAARFGAAWFGAARFGAAWFGAAWFGAAWFGAVGAGQVVHVVGSTPFALRRQEVVWPAFAHEPSVSRGPAGEWVMLFSSFRYNETGAAAAQ
jgi:hypothetical protein